MEQKSLMPTKLVILTEEDLAREELATINRMWVEPSKNIMTITSQQISGIATIAKLDYSIFIVNMQQDGAREWVSDQKNWFMSNPDLVKVVYRRCRGDPMTMDEMKTLKQSFACMAVRKHLPESADSFAVYLGKVLTDHVSHKVIKQGGWVAKIKAWVWHQLVKLICS